MEQRYYIWFAAVVGVLIGIGGWMFFQATPAQAPSINNATATTSTDLGNGISIETTGGGTVKVISDGSAIQPPAVAPLVFSADLPADAKVALQSQFATYSAQLKAAPTRVDLWLKLGVVYKIAGDYQNAIDAWTYVAKTGGTTVNYVAYGNLGDLYLNFLHDYAKAEASYKVALKLQPANTDYQAGLKAAQTAQGK